MSTTLNTTPSHIELTTLNGQSVGLNDTLVKFTYMGDNDLTGDYEGLEDFYTANGIGAGHGGWINGDYNYDGVADSTDSTILSDWENTYYTGPLTFGSPVSGDRHILTNVYRIETAYNDQGQVYTVTSFNASSGGSAVNQVEDFYNGLGQLTTEYQDQAGSVGLFSSGYVSYTYDTLANGSRITSMTDPEGDVLYYDYGTIGSLNDVISRLNSLIDGSTTVEGYAYLGLSTVVIRSHPQDGVDLTYVMQAGGTTGDAGDQYIGLDRFGRVADQQWIDGSGTLQDGYLYTYDADGNVTAKTNVLNGVTSETYTYDGLNRLLTTTRDGTTYQTFGMDAVGNIDSVDTSGTTVDNTTNDQNELTGVGGATLAYDNNGNTTTDDQGHTLIYDGWNRLVEVLDGSTILETFSYDGMGRQITETPGDGNTTNLYYSAADQVIEEDIAAQGLTLHARYVWSPVYVNAMVFRDFDFNDTGTLTLTERTYVMQDANYNVTGLITATTGSGDVDGDGTVTSADLAILTKYIGHTAAGGDAVGDFNHDGTVDFSDFIVISNNLGTTYTGAPTWSVAERLVYDAYGKFTVDAANWSSATDIYAWNYTFQGMRYDPITKLNITLSRVYEAETGRFLTVDPSGLSGMNNYWAFGDNPINVRDFTGFEILKAAGNSEIDTGEADRIGEGTVAGGKIHVYPSAKVIKGERTGQSLVVVEFAGKGCAKNAFWIQVITQTEIVQPGDKLDPATFTSIDGNGNEFYLPNGSPHVDVDPSRKTVSFVDNQLTGIHGDNNELLWDNPDVFNGDFSKLTVQADDYLIIDKKPVWHVRWTAGGGQGPMNRIPDFKITLSSGTDLDLPASLLPDKVVVGYSDPEAKKAIVVDNPIGDEYRKGSPSENDGNLPIHGGIGGSMI